MPSEKEQKERKKPDNEKEKEDPMASRDNYAASRIKKKKNALVMSTQERKRLEEARQDTDIGDATITVEGRDFQAHRFVLCSVSPYMESLFLGGMSESVSSTVVLEDLSAATFEALITWMYTGEATRRRRARKETLTVPGGPLTGQWAQCGTRWLVMALVAQQASYHTLFDQFSHEIPCCFAHSIPAPMFSFGAQSMFVSN